MSLNRLFDIFVLRLLDDKLRDVQQQKDETDVSEWMRNAEMGCRCLCVRLVLKSVARSAEQGEARQVRSSYHGRGVRGEKCERRDQLMQKHPRSCSSQKKEK